MTLTSKLVVSNPMEANLHVTPCRIRTSRNIATLTRDSNRVYTVTAGTSSGSCTANFTENNHHNRDGDRGQNVNLRVVNQP